MLTWLPRYPPEWLRADLIAGITVAAYLIPAGMGDATSANLPPEAGLYACMFAGLILLPVAASLALPSPHTLVRSRWLQAWAS